MKNFIHKLFLFALPFVLFYTISTLFILPDILERLNGINIKKQITQSFENSKKSSFDMIIFGNSRPYRGINPDKFSIKTYNFAHDFDSYNQIYHKIKWLEKNNIKYKQMILGVDYFQFGYLSETKNYIYSKYLGHDYFKDYENYSFIDDFLFETNFLIFSRIKNMIYINSSQNKSIYLKNNGQYIVPGKATEKDFKPLTINRIEIQEKYFDSIIKYSKKNNIKVFLCTMHSRENVLKNFKANEISEFNRYLKSHSDSTVYFLNYTNNINFSIDDYMDVIHLNEKGADKFSLMLNDTIHELLNKKHNNN